MNDIIAFRPEKPAHKPYFGRKVPHRVQAAGKALNFKAQGAIFTGVILRVIRSDHRHPGAEIGSGGSNLARIGSDPAVCGSKLAGEQENVHEITSVCR